MLHLSRPGEKRFAYGFWRFEAQEVDTARDMLALARELGIDHIDTADVYGGASGFGGAEKLLGAVRKAAPSLFDGAVLATKAGVELGTPYNNSATYLTAACEASLQRLGVERVDLFYVHRHDLLVHPAEVAGALDGLVAAGKIGAVAVSNYTAAQVDALKAHLKAPLVAHQIEFSAAHVAPLFDGALDQAMRDGFAIAAWSPLAGGRLGEGGPAEFAGVTAALDKIAARYGVPRSAVAMAFVQRHGSCATPIIGTKTAARLRECVAGRALELTRREWYDVLEARLGARMP